MVILESNPETIWGTSEGPIGPLEENTGLLVEGLPNSGPEKACLLTFLASCPLCDSNRGGDILSDKGEGRGREGLLLSLSLTTTCAFETVLDVKLSSKNFLGFSMSRGDECQRLLLLPFTLAVLERMTEVFDLEVELLASAGVGRAYAWNFGTGVCNSLIFSDKSNLSEYIGAE